MGINSWNAFHCNVDERKMRAMADALVSTGLAKAGYQYVNIGIQSPAPTQYIPPSSGNDSGLADDCWQVMRSPNGTINADPERFPGGMKALAVSATTGHHPT
jgi:alpha-galactosidase